MGTAVNRMLTRAITVATGATTTLIGVGREGVLNGGDKITVGLDGTGLTGDLTVTISLRPTTGATLDPLKTTYPIVHATRDSIAITGLCAYEVVMTCTTTAIVDEVWYITSTVQRG